MTRARDIANFGDGIATADIGDGQVTAGKLNSTLDLTGKTVTLPSGVGGQIVQTVTTTTTSELSQGSSGYSSFMTLNITTETDNPKLLCICEPARLILGTGPSTAFTRFVCTGGEATGVRYFWVNRNTSTNEYSNPIHTAVLETSSATTGTTLTVALQISNATGQNNDILGDSGGTSRLTVMEIAG